MWAAVTARLSARVKSSNWAITGQINTGVGESWRNPAIGRRCQWNFAKHNIWRMCLLVPSSCWNCLIAPFPCWKWLTRCLRHMLNSLHIILGHFQQGRRYTMFNVWADYYYIEILLTPLHPVHHSKLPPPPPEHTDWAVLCVGTYWLFTLVLQSSGGGDSPILQINKVIVMSPG